MYAGEGDRANKFKWSTIEYKLILAVLIDSEQMLLSIEAQLCYNAQQRLSMHASFAKGLLTQAYDA